MPCHKSPPKTYGRPAVHHRDAAYLFVRRHKQGWTRWRDTEESTVGDTTPTAVGSLRADDLFIFAPLLSHSPLLWFIHKWKDQSKDRLGHHLQPIQGSSRMSKKKGSLSSALRRRMKKKKKQGTSSPVSNRTQGSSPGRDLIDPPTADDPPPIATTTPA